MHGVFLSRHFPVRLKEIRGKGKGRRDALEREELENQGRLTVSKSDPAIGQILMRTDHRAPLDRTVDEFEGIDRKADRLIERQGRWRQR